MTKDKQKEICRDGEIRKLPINDAGIVSYIFMTWFSPLVWKMYKTRIEPIDQRDVWWCSDKESVRENVQRIRHLWDQEIGKYGIEQASFFRVWMQFVWVRTLAAIAMVTIYAIAYFLSAAFLVKLVLSYLESDVYDMAYGVWLTVGVLFCEVVRACCLSLTIIFGAQTGARFRSGMNGLLYNKILGLKALHGKDAEIVNIFTVDSYRVYSVNELIVFVLSLPIFLGIVAVFCYYLVGYWSIVAMGTFLLLYLIQFARTKPLQNLRKRCVRYTDKRIKYMSEILSNMKFIKLYAWEQPFKRMLKDVRKKEQKYILRSALIDITTSSIIYITPAIASVVTLSLYTAFGNELTASTAFALIGTMNFMRHITGVIPFALRLLSEAKVSFDRIKKLLEMEDYNPPSNQCSTNTSAVEMKDAAFSWCSEDNSLMHHIQKDQPQDITIKYTLNKGFQMDDDKQVAVVDSLTSALTDLTLSVNQGQLIGICGAVGSGKSSLIHALLGRMHQLSGHMAVKGTVAYVGQQAWIFNGSVKDNILFGLEYKEDRYNEVIRCCGLESDLQYFNFGDKTEIGEHGINISGGQKQRINLARAAYSSSDIYLLDDPLSALDTQVGQHVFHACIRGHLQGKTVLLVTHQLQYMVHCDEVFVLEKGKPVEVGPHKKLLSVEGVYSKMFRAFERTTMKTGTERGPNKQEDKQSTHKYVVLQNSNPASSIAKTEPQEETLIQGSLMRAERTASGTGSYRVYRAFIHAAGGWPIAASTALTFLIGAASLVFIDWWLSQWTQATYNKTNRDAMVNVSANTSSSLPYLNTSANATSDDSALPSTLDEHTYLTVYVTTLTGIILFQLFKGYIGAKVPIKASEGLHSKCLESVLKAPMSFFETNPDGRILNRFTKDLDEGDVYIPLVLNLILQHGCLALLTIIVSAYILPWMLIAVVPVGIIFFILKKVLSVSVRKLKRLENVTRSPLISQVKLTSEGLSSITAYGQQNSFFERFSVCADATSNMSLLYSVCKRWISMRLDILAGLLTAATSLICVLSKGILSATAAGLVLSLIGKTVYMLEYFVVALNDTEARFTSIERIHEYGEFLEHEAQQGVTPLPNAWPVEGAVEFRNVSMRYRKHLELVLRNVSFIINPRENVGVVGRTGAGKTSLVMCMFRLHELGKGTILVDGLDVSTLSLTCLRSRISTIPQDPVLFNGSIRFNIDPFSAHTDDYIWNALEKASMKQKIRQFDDSLDFKVAENGNNFSVGERQLICLARAILRKNKILILDEATANIDTSTDAMIQDTIRTCFADCTVITIAHRLNTVIHSDKIIVMDAGQVIECGLPNDPLANQESLLNKMLAAQTSELQTFQNV